MAGIYQTILDKKDSKEMNKVCPECCLPNDTLMWWEKRTGHWVCYGCGMDRKTEELQMHKTWIENNGTTPTA